MVLGAAWGLSGGVGCPRQLRSRCPSGRLLGVRPAGARHPGLRPLCAYGGKRKLNSELHAFWPADRVSDATRASRDGGDAPPLRPPPSQVAAAAAKPPLEALKDAVRKLDEVVLLPWDPR